MDLIFAVFLIGGVYYGISFLFSILVANMGQIVTGILLASCLFVIWKTYEYLYYTGENFIRLKQDLDEYIVNCNSLNEHIEDLKQTYSDIKKINYGNAELKDSSTYNFKRLCQVKAEKSDFIYECSASICKNAEVQPFKYLCKYFNIKPKEGTLETFENVLNNFSAAEEGKILLKKELEKIKDSIKNNIPYLIRTFTMKKFMRKLGFEEIDFSTLYFPIYSFRYISPGGNKSSTSEIKLDIDNLDNFVEYLSELVKFRKSAKGQRALMNLNLRERIKIRDNYTCKNCGLSIKDEPNLLLEIDHIIPISKGGMSTEGNLQTLCWKCNRSKGAKINI